ncbi:uncharacterized protein LOC131670769 [Phymastichus coffea]|uniref:uncharacterized protein LOC131670769 n=1 Tax=Phymastichus coffea TaxID=108790 RepID=UPI00273B8A6C|nr:uncharacterized protein LOC131670769 [Phymastichus coffea]
MVLSQGLMQLKDEQMSEKSEANSIESENPARIEDIFEWIDGIPLSKTTKNLARDFSDAVLMSEILKFYYPNLVNSHNYIPANSIQNKKENWNTLNRKVLTKIDLRLNQETIDQLAHSQVGAIERLLNEFRDKQMATKIKDTDFSDVNLHHLERPRTVTTQKKVEDEPRNERSIFSRMLGAIVHFFATIFGIILAILCFWRWFSRKSKPQSVKLESKALPESEEQRHEDELSHLRESYAQTLEELRVKADVIKTLCHKVAFLEGTMKLKDMKISGLANQLDAQQQFQMQQQQQLQVPELSAKSNAASNPTTKIRKRPRTQI